MSAIIRKMAFTDLKKPDIRVQHKNQGNNRNCRSHCGTETDLFLSSRRSGVTNTKYMDTSIGNDNGIDSFGTDDQEKLNPIISP